MEETFDQRLERIVNDIELGMKCKVRLGVSPEGRRFVQIQCWRMDVITKKEDWGYGGKGFPSEYATDNEIVQMIFGLYKSYWEHEARETFEWRGRRVYGPHISLDALYEVARRVEYRDAAHAADQPEKDEVPA